ncbi:RepB family plasmid replication initiator protein [Roseomonas mucosa]
MTATATFVNVLPLLMSESAKQLRTTDVEPDEHMLIKPGELIDIVELSPLTLQDRRIYNLLILNAWDSITEPKEHRIHKRDLRGSHNVNDRVGESLLRLMGAVAQLRIERDAGDGQGPETFTRRVQLLAGTEESLRGNGVVYYSFPAAVRGIIRESSQYARLQKQVMFALSSKYALTLYEMVQKRGNMTWKTSEEFTLDRFRSLLGVEDGKLQAFKSFKQRAIDPAVLEVNGLGEFGCKVEPVFTGRKVTAVRLSWWKKNLDERMHALNELRFSRIGRKARLANAAVVTLPVAGALVAPSQDVADAPDLLTRVSGRPQSQSVADKGAGRASRRASLSQFVADRPGRRAGEGRGGRASQSVADSAALPSAGISILNEAQTARFRRDFPGLDIPWLEREFRAWVADKEPPNDPVKAFYGFMKRKRDEAQ